MIKAPIVFQTTAHALVDMVINHISVRPTAQSGDDYLSSFDLLENPDNVCIAGTGGVALFVADGPGAYIGHIFLMDGARGAGGLAFGKAALEALFARKTVRKVSAQVPQALPAARWYVRRLGFSSLGGSPDGLEEFFEISR